MEATEVKEFEDQIKEGGEHGLKRVSLIISVLAVLVAMVTVLGHRTHTEAVISQTRAADKWNEFQAKKIRLEQDKDTSAILSHLPSVADTEVEKLKKHADKETEEIPELQNQATELEADVHLAEHKAARFDLAEALLEIGVVLSSITLLTRQSHFYIAGSLLGIAGLVIAITGLLMK